MSILFSGDFHANSRGELRNITKDALLNNFGGEIYNSINYHIILGDCGFLWPDNEEGDKKNYEVLAERNFPILCVMGNHEPIYGVKKKQEIDMGFENTVYKINDNPLIVFLKRGKVYTIEGIKFLVLGGALSIDKYRRTPNRSWWEQEYWSKKEKKELFELLENDNIFDCVISHTGPWHINVRLFHRSYPLSIGGNYDKVFDEVSKLNDEVHNNIQFREWWCGHYHNDIYHYNKNPKHSYQYLYYTTKIMDKIKNKIRVRNEYGLKRNQIKEEL